MDVRVTKIGDIDFFQVIEMEIGPEVESIFTQERLAQAPAIRWLSPAYLDGQGHMRALSQCFIFAVGRRVVAVDTCIGNAKHRPEVPRWDKLQTTFAEAFRKTGYHFDDVTDVLCTHMHADHVGWNTTLEDGSWAPTFRNAKYYFASREYQAFTNARSQIGSHNVRAFEDSIAPVIISGQAVFVEADADLGDGISLVSTPGHTAGHVSIRVQATEGSIFITGDAIHHPCQMANVDWSTNIDYDPREAAVSRQNLLRLASRPNTFLAGTHFAIPSIGRVIECTDGNYEFRAPCCD